MIGAAVAGAGIVFGFAYAFRVPQAGLPLFARRSDLARTEPSSASKRRQPQAYLRAVGLSIVGVAIVLDLSLLVVGDPARLPGPLGPLMEDSVIPWAQDVILPLGERFGLAGGEEPSEPAAETPPLADAVFTPTALAIVEATPSVAPPTLTGPTPTVAAPTPTPLAVAAPARLLIPSAGVDAPVVPVSVDGNGRMGTPRTAYEVGWYGPNPGHNGNALLAGHVDWLQDGKPVRGAFYLLRKVQPGETITVRTTDGTDLDFRVDWIRFYDADNAPVEEILGPTAESSITLITCGGEFDRTLQSYSHRWVVRATLAAAGSNE